MTHDENLRALLTERYSAPVREYKPQSRPAPIAELLDNLRDLTDEDEDSTLKAVS